MISLSRFIFATSVMIPLLFGSLSALAVEQLNCDCKASGFGVSTARDIARCSLSCSAKSGGFTTDEKTKYSSDDIANIIGNIINVILAFLGVAFMVLVVYAGGLWMFAGGEEEKVTTAKNILQSALLGVLIVISAYVIMNFIFRQLLESAFTT